MAKKQTRRGVSLSKDTYAMLKKLSDKKGVACSQIVTHLIEGLFDDEIDAAQFAPKPEPRLKPKPKPERELTRQEEIYDLLSDDDETPAPKEKARQLKPHREIENRREIIEAILGRAKKEARLTDLFYAIPSPIRPKMRIACDLVYYLASKEFLVKNEYGLYIATGKGEKLYGT